MAGVAKKAYKQLAEVLEGEGVTDYEFRGGKKHPSIVFWVNGIMKKKPISRSPSDHRTMKNACSQIKRLVAEAPEQAA